MNISLSDRTAATERKRVVEKISVIVPVTERYDDLDDVCRDCRRALDGLHIPYEMIFVVDGPFDKAYRQLKAMKNEGENLTIIKQARTTWP